MSKGNQRTQLRDRNARLFIWCVTGPKKTARESGHARAVNPVLPGEYCFPSYYNRAVVGRQQSSPSSGQKQTVLWRGLKCQS